MSKYMVLWRLDTQKIPVDPKQRAEGWGHLMSMVKRDMEKKIVLDWGAFLSEGRGYSIYQGTEIEIMTALQQYVPYCEFRVHPIASVMEVNEMIRNLSH